MTESVCLLALGEAMTAEQLKRASRGKRAMVDDAVSKIHEAWLAGEIAVEFGDTYYGFQRLDSRYAEGARLDPYSNTIELPPDPPVQDEGSSATIQLGPEPERKVHILRQTFAEKFRPDKLKYLSGAPGRPGSSPLVLAEAHRRKERGEIPTARELHDWLQEEHPNAPKIALKTIRNALSKTRRAAKE